MKQVQAQLVFVLLEKLIEALLVVSRQKTDPSCRYGVGREMGGAMVSGECLNARAPPEQCGFQRLSVEVQPRQTQVVGISKLGIHEPARVERGQEFIVTQMGRGKHQRHKAIMTDSPSQTRFWATSPVHGYLTANTQIAPPSGTSGYLPGISRL